VWAVGVAALLTANIFLIARASISFACEVDRCHDTLLHLEKLTLQKAVT